MTVLNSFDTSIAVIDLAIERLQGAKLQLSYATDKEARYSIAFTKMILDCLKFEDDEDDKVQ